MTLEEVKNFLKVDFSDDDYYINLLMEVAAEYIADALGSYNEQRKKQQLLYLSIIDYLYKNRAYTVEKNSPVNSVIKSIILQEQLKNV